MSYDFSTAEKTQTFDIIPAGTVVCLHLAVLAGDEGTPENAFVVTKTDLYQLVLECTVTEGEYAKRKIFHRLTMGAQPHVTMTEGQQKGVSISRSFIRSVLEAARGFSPTDESAEAISARKMESLFELDGLEVWCELGIEKGTGNYSDRNTIKKVLNAKAEGPKSAPKPAASVAQAAPLKAPPPKVAAKPSWAS